MPPQAGSTGDHGCDGRWQVRYRDDTGAQRKRTFERRPDADRFDAETKNSLHKGEYLDPASGQIILSACSEEWRAGLAVDPTTLEGVDSRLSPWVHGQRIGSDTMASRFPSGPDQRNKTRSVPPASTS